MLAEEGASFDDWVGRSEIRGRIVCLDLESKTAEYHGQKRSVRNIVKSPCPVYTGTIELTLAIRPLDDLDQSFPIQLLPQSRQRSEDPCGEPGFQVLNGSLNESQVLLDFWNVRLGSAIFSAADIIVVEPI